MSKKYKVYVPVDYISGYLRYGHLELNIESEKELTKEEIIKYAKEEQDYGNLVVDDYSVEDYDSPSFDDLTYEEIMEKK